jgi:DNA-directed RNA polymerase specialized sigma24 family protein
MIAAVETSRTVDSIITDLPSRIAVVILVCDIEGLSDRETAEKLGIPHGTVKTGRRDGHELLRKLFAREGLV